MFVFVWSSRRSRLHALPQDLRTRLFSVWFYTKHLCFALEGQGMPCEASPHITGHGQRPPAGVLMPSAMYIAGRHSLLLVGTQFWQNGNLDKMAILSSRLLFICFCRYFITAVWHFVPLHTRVCRDGFLVSLPCKLYKIGSSIRGALPSWLRVRHFRDKKYRGELWF